VKSRYRLAGYLAGAAAARAGDEMSGPALLVLAFAVTGRAGTGSAILAGLTIAAAAGGPVFGTLLDRARRPEWLLAGALGGYALGIIAIQTALGREPAWVAVLLALLAGLFNPSVAGGWTSQLPRLVSGDALPRASAFDAMSYSVASLTGPALAAIIAGWLGARAAPAAAAALILAAVPAACSLGRLAAARPAVTPQTGARPAVTRGRRAVLAGFAAIISRPALARATVTSMVSYVGIGMLVVCCPVLGARRLGGSAHGALLLSAMAAASLIANALLARRPSRSPDRLVLASTVLLGASMAAAAIAPGWLAVPAVALGGAGEGPQLTGLFAVRHREAPAAMRGQIFTTAASLKIAGLAAGAALAGPLATRSVTGCLLAAAGSELLACLAWFLLSLRHG
jgi:predicted MFS family arabinose efflux permease